MTRRDFLTLSSAGLLTGAAARMSGQNRPPNIVLILADDLGYGDLGCYGSKIPTPNLDRMAQEGARFTHFYSASAVSSPSRAALLTGRYAVRMNIPGVLFPNDTRGIPETETTVPQTLKEAGYRTACIGKWHVGSRPQFLPTSRGFDEFFGLPYSHDMLPLPLMRQTDAVEDAPGPERLTERFTQEAVSFLQRQKDSPFFLYFPHTAPHIPLRASARFRGLSKLGPYGDSVEELDWSVGEVLRALGDNGLDGNTLVIFTSDNGPWYQGSKAELRGRKGETYEGGMRAPFLARLPDRIPAGRTVQGMATTMDLLPTFARLTGAPYPGQPLDGVDIWPMLAGQREEVEREAFLYFETWQMQCARMGRWKLHLSRYNTAAWMPAPPGGRLNLPLPRPELYDLEADSEEVYDVAADNPQVVAEIRQRVDRLLETFPAQVRDAWRDTMRLPVEDTPAGAPPVLRTP